MTELERILKDTLTKMEQDMTATLETHSKALAELQQTLVEQRRSLDAQRQTLNRQQEQISRIAAEQQESVRHLQRLSDIHKSLEPLLSRLNALLNGR